MKRMSAARKRDAARYTTHNITQRAKLLDTVSDGLALCIALSTAGPFYFQSLAQNRSLAVVLLI